MSAILYGRLVKRAQTTPPIVALSAEDTATRTEEKKENKLAAGVAALVPSDILALHALVLARTTTTNEAGTTTIIDPTPLKWSLIALALAAAVAYLIGRGFQKWTRADFVRLILPPVAFVAWTALIGTSSLTPWTSELSQGWLVLAAGLLAILLIAIHSRVGEASADSAD